MKVGAGRGRETSRGLGGYGGASEYGTGIQTLRAPKYM